MSEKEKNIIRRLSNSVQKLDKEKQNYILGVTEGMVIARYGNVKIAGEDKQLQETSRQR